MTPLELLVRCQAAGLTLHPVGDRLAVSLAARLTPQLAAQLRAAKAQLLALLAAGPGLRPDELPWLPVAGQVLAGEFDSGTRSELESVWFGVRTIRHPVCQQARARLETLLGRRPRPGVAAGEAPVPRPARPPPRNAPGNEPRP
jgi:hypothetical protein